MKVTIQDIANITQYSATTVSRVLCGSIYPVEKTAQQRIIAEALALGYTSPFMRNLDKQKKSGIIGVVIPTISNPYYHSLLRGIEHRCKDYGLSVVYTSSQQIKQKEIYNIKNLLKAGICGLIINSIIDDNNLLYFLASKNFPVICINSKPSENLPSVLFDYYNSASIAVEYLCMKGHKEIAFASGPLNSPDRKDAYEGFIATLKKFGRTIRKEYLYISQTASKETANSIELAQGQYYAQKICGMQNKPTAVFCINDMMAMGMISEFKIHGVLVPEEISILGFDDLETSVCFTPKLTTIKQPAFETGTLATELLKAKMSNPKQTIQNINLQPLLIERDSVIALH